MSEIMLRFKLLNCKIHSAQRNVNLNYISGQIFYLLYAYMIFERRSRKCIKNLSFWKNLGLIPERICVWGGKVGGQHHLCD